MTRSENQDVMVELMSKGVAPILSSRARPIAVGSGVRSSVLVLVISLGACTKAEPPPKPDTLASSEVQAVEPAVDPCIELAQLYCENTPIACEQMELLLREAEVPAASCATAAHDTRALVASMTEMDRVILPMVLNRQLAQVLLDSPKLDDAKRAELQAIVDGQRPPAAGPPADEAEFDIDRMDVSCPGVSQARGQMPPNGSERWCERADGRRHGPAQTWNGAGELVRTVEYVDGEAVEVSFRMPASRELAPELFMCPKGSSEAKGDRSRRACVGGNGLVEGPAVSWRDGKVVMIESYQGGEAVSMTGMIPSPAAR